MGFDENLIQYLRKIKTDAHDNKEGAETEAPTTLVRTKDFSFQNLFNNNEAERDSKQASNTIEITHFGPPKCDPSGMCQVHLKIGHFTW